MENSKVVYEDDRAFVQDDVLNSPDLDHFSDLALKPKKMEAGLNRIIIVSALFSLSISLALIISNYTIRTSILKHGGVSSTSGSCSKLGLNLMRSNSGNGIDTVVATTLCEALQNNSCGLLGGGILLYRRHTHNLSYVYNFLGNDPDRLQNKNGSQLGLPTLLRALSTIHKNHGSLDWKCIIDYVLVYAHEIQKNKSSNDFHYIIEILTNISLNVDSFYESYIIKKFADQSTGDFPSLKLIQDYDVAVEKPIYYQFYDYLLEIPSPPSNGIILILFLNIMVALKEDFKVRPNLVTYGEYVHKASMISDSHAGLFLTNSTQEIVTLLSKREYASEIAKKIFSNETIPDLPVFDYFGTPTSNVVVVSPDDDIVSLSLTLGMSDSDPAKEIFGLKLNANNRLMVNLSPIVLSNPDKPCLLRIGSTHEGKMSSPLEIGRLILQLNNNNSTNLGQAIGRTMNSSSSLYDETDKFISLGKYGDFVSPDVQSNSF